MTEARINATRERFERDSGDLQGIVQLKMLGQGYDFPPITVVVPMRPYGSFSEFYQFIGRGIRILLHPALEGRVGPREQFLDIIYHAELGLNEHIDTIYRENDMNPLTVHELPLDWQKPHDEEALPGTRGHEQAQRPEAFVLFEPGAIEQRLVHDEQRVEQRRVEREREALAQRYASYAQSSDCPVTFEQYVELMRQSVNDIIESFGRKANRTQSISTLFDLEQAEERCKRFTELDSFIGELLVYSLRSQRLATMTQGKLGANTVTIHGLSVERQAFMDSTFRLEHQQSRGAWFLPTEASLKVGVINLPWAFQTHCRFASSIVWEERGKISLQVPQMLFWFGQSSNPCSRCCFYLLSFEVGWQEPSRVKSNFRAGRLSIRSWGYWALKFLKSLPLCATVAAGTNWRLMHNLKPRRIYWKRLRLR
jgi:hypothetical protein